MRHRFKLASLLRAMRERRGIAAAEYAILAVGIVLVVGSAVVLLNDPVNGAFGQMGRSLIDGQAALNSSAGAGPPR